MPASSHPASYPNQDSYAYGDDKSDQRAVLDLAGHPVQSVVAELGAELGGFVAKTHGLVTGQAPAAAKAVDDFGHGRGDGVTDMIAGRRHTGGGVPAGRSPNSFKLVLKGAYAALDGGDVGGECRWTMVKHGTYPPGAQCDRSKSEWTTGSHGEARCQPVHGVEPMPPACVRRLSRNAETIETVPTDNDFESLV
jgi:hypothetical protein